MTWGPKRAGGGRNKASNLPPNRKRTHLLRQVCQLLILGWLPNPTIFHMIRIGWLVVTLPNPCQPTYYLEDHPRTCKWLGSPPFVSHTVRPFGRVVPQPCQASPAFIQAQVKATVDATSKDLGLNSDKVSFGEKVW